VALPRYWPNEISRANSDSWLAENHDAIRVMYPKVLVLNFVNGWSGFQEKLRSLMDAIALSTAYHGYEDPGSKPFLRYEVAGCVDLADPPGTPTPDGNSTRYPRVPGWQQGNNFAYEELYGETFSRFFGFEDPDHAGMCLNLAELIDRGIVHELFFFAVHGDHGAPLETIENKQYYDETFSKIDAHGGAGNGHYPGMPWTGRSFRITFVNYQRGIGCALENLGHALEGMAHFDFCPYWRRYFYEFAGFDLDARFGLPFGTLYGGGPYSYPSPDVLEWERGSTHGSVHNYRVVGGNVHFPPNARWDYDLTNTRPVWSTIEHYRRFDGWMGEDRRILWTPRTFWRYNEAAPDCMGPWLVYWRQNMPGCGNPSVDDDGAPMSNWWPFLFY